MTDIFLSYNRNDAAVARLFTEGFEREGLSVWWDVTLRSGEAYDEVTEAALRGAKAVVVLWSPRSVISRWVRAEATMADRCKTLLPVMIEPCERPIMFELTQTAELAHWDGAPDDPAWLAFLSDVRRFLEREGPQELDNGEDSRSGVHLHRLARNPTLHSEQTERRRVTLLRGYFADVASTAEASDPEILDERLVALAALLRAEVQACSALLSQLDSTGFSIVFGVPVAHGDDEVFAAETAFRIAGLVRVDHEFELHMGLASGVSLVAFEQASGSVRVTGGISAKAEALARQAGPGELMVSGATRTWLAPYFATREVGLEAFSVLERTAVRTRIDAAQIVGLSPLIGRLSELAMLDRTLEDAIESQGRVLCLLGDPGVGKSRLAHEFRGHALDRELKVIDVHCNVHDRIKTHGPFVDLLHELLGTGQVGVDEIEEQVAKRVLAIDPRLETCLPYLLHLMSVASTTRQLAPALTGLALRRAVGEAIVATVIAKTQAQTLVLILDDWHWADEASIETLNRLVEACAFHQIMVLVCTRPEAPPSWPPLPHCSQTMLQPLSRPDVSELVRTLAQASKISVDVGELLFGRTDGIPLYVEELTRSLLEQEKIGVDEDVLSSREGIDVHELPGNIEAVVRSRLDRLDRDILEFLRVASVGGRHFGVGFLYEFIGDPNVVDRCLAKAIALGLIQQTRLIPERLYRFHHALTQVVVYESLLLKRRREIHRHMGEWLETREEGVPNEHLEALAHHFLQAELPDKAVAYLKRAGTLAAQTASHVAAIDFFRSAVGLLEKQTQSSERDVQLLDACVSLANSLHFVQGYVTPEVVGVFERAQELSRTAAPGPAHFSSLWMLCRALCARALINQAGEVADMMLQLANESGEQSQLLPAYVARGWVETLLGWPTRARETLEKAVELYCPETEMSLLPMFGELPSARALSLLACSYLRVCDVSKGLELFARAIEICRKFEHRSSEMSVLIWQQIAMTMIEDSAKAAIVRTTLLELATKYQVPHFMVLSRMNDGQELIAAGDIEEGLRLFRPASEAVDAVGVFQVKELQLITFALVEYYAGRLDAGLALIEQAREFAKFGGLCHHTAEVERIAVRLMWQRDATVALTHAQSELADAISRQNLSSALRLAVEIADLLDRDGRSAEGLEILDPVWEHILRLKQGDAPCFTHAEKLLQILRAKTQNMSRINS